MKIIEQTSNRLKLQANHLIETLRLITIFAIVPIIIGLWIIFYMAKESLFQACLFGVPFFVFPLLLVKEAISKQALFAIWTFDKSLDLVKREKRFLRNIEITEWQLTEIKYVKVEEHIFSDPERRDSKRYNLRFEIKSGGHVPIYFLGVSSKKEYQKWAKFICKFLNLEA
jgi:hypothetical protein